MIKLRGWTKIELLKIIFTLNNNEYNDTNFIDLDSGLHKYSRIFYNTFSSLVSFLFLKKGNKIAKTQQFFFKKHIHLNLFKKMLDAII
jgi:hypothetical protein